MIVSHLSSTLILFIAFGVCVHSPLPVSQTQAVTMYDYLFHPALPATMDGFDGWLTGNDHGPRPTAHGDTGTRLNLGHALGSAALSAFLLFLCEVYFVTLHSYGR
ncbi:hypothetical protein BGZ63DRAFT_385532 [Mariannaea sp. PMI_226]|nr:hypothetical protein BGZ63DRAFT_385532 [Mariannaea sp. PMI_226]